MKKMTIDGNTAAALSTYATNEVAIIYPITPSSPMAEACDEWSAKGKENIFGNKMKIVEMQSEGGAAGALHGSLLTGSLTTTFTASQGLLLMIPNMYKIAGELLPCVFNVSARALATHALSIFGDHSDVMACRQTGFTFICSKNVQECFDLATISMITTLNSSLPVLHFFDGFRTSHEINKIEVLENEEIAKLIPFEKIQEFKKRALNPFNPKQYGTAQNPDVYFQNREASEQYYQAVGKHFKNACEEYAKLTGRKYAPFTYYGAPDAERVIVAMGSGTETLESVIDICNQNSKIKVGLINVTLYRPFYTKDFINTLPKTVKTITVLDRTKEGGSVGEPLYLDVCTALLESNINIPVLNGRYGIGGKDFTPACALAVIQNCTKNGKRNFTVGINDDVTNTSLPLPEFTLQSKSTQCMFYGLGSDGTVSANKNTIKIIGDLTDLYAQGYFVYDSKKSGSVTISHLRFGKEFISAPYEIDVADFIACHNARYIGKYDFLPKLRNGGTLLLNCDWEENEIEEKLPATFKRELANKNINFYIINAQKIANELGLRGKINTIMQSAFFRLSNIIPYENAVTAMKDAALKSYGKAGEEVVQKNYQAIDAGGKQIIKINIPNSWKNAESKITTSYMANDTKLSYDRKFYNNIMKPITELKGDKIPVSAFNPDGHTPIGTARLEKRGVATNIPCWIKENCIQCNMCSFVCPHGAIKPVLLTTDDEKYAPKTFETIPAMGMNDLKFRLQISPLDCTGCGSCANICPSKQKALEMKEGDQQIVEQQENWKFAEYYSNIYSSLHDQPFNKYTLKGSQFLPTHFQFSGACAGCGETPYIKLLTQLYGKYLLIANATGCSSIYGGSFPSCPYTADEHSFTGPAWANSLFEDNAEFGLGYRISLDVKKAEVAKYLQIVADNEPDLKPLVEDWFDAQNLEESAEASNALYNQFVEKLHSLSYTTDEGGDAIKYIMKNLEDDLNDKTVWIIGGDGWAYDIGYGGLDHVLASGKNVNILVLDSQVYSNTGGQASKATPAGAVAKFADDGKRTSKKNLGLMALSYPDVYVAQIAMGANMVQSLNAIKEACEYDGVSLIIAYSTCINHGIDMSQGMKTMREAVQSGYWHLFRYHPLTKKLTLDSPEPTADFIEFAKKERRFSNLFKKNPEQAQELLEKAKQDSELLYNKLKKLADNN